MVILKPGHFMVNGVNSWTSNGLKVLIQNRPELQTPKRKREFKSPLGVSGDLVFDENAYEPTPLKLELLIEGKTEQDVINNRDKLYMMFNSPGYASFTPYFDPNKQYNVICTDPPTFISKWWMNGNQTAEMELMVQPYKYFLGVVDTVLTTAGNISNPYAIPSQPLIKIEGTGDVVLKVNGISHSIKAIEGHIYIDSELFGSYRKSGSVITNDNSKTYFREYPILKPGNNLIEWTGSVTKVTISPRWRSLT